jgi:Activator of Hsp90 ATPase homolog 1-like protein
MIAAMKQMGRPTSQEARARFTEIRPHDRLAIASVIEFLPGMKPYESTIVAEFFPSGETVRMVLTLDPMHDDMFTNMQTEGFTSQLSKLDKRYGGEKR